MAIETSTVSQLTTFRDKLWTAVNALADDPLKSYQIGDKRFTFQDIEELYMLIERVDKRLAAASPAINLAKFDRRK